MFNRGLAVVLALGCTVSVALAAPVSTEIRLNSILLDTTHLPSVPEGMQVKPGTGIEGEIALVQFPGPVTAKQRAALDKFALKVFTYLPDNAFLVRLPAGATEAAARETGARWAGAYHPLYKISADVAAVRAPEVEERSPRVRSLFVQVYPDADLREVIQRIRDLGVAEIAGAKENPYFSRIRLLLTDAEMVRFREDLAGLSEVFWIDLEPRRALLNDTTIWVGQ